jgi:hypothetical protein
MNPRTLSQLGLGLLGIWALIEALALFPQVAPLASMVTNTGGAQALVFGIILPVALLFGLSYLLVFHSEVVSRRVFREFDPSPSDPSVLQARVAVGLLGVLILALAIPHLVASLILFADERMAASVPLREVISYAVQTALALFLIVRPEALLGFWSTPGKRAA